ncbi:MAG: hypothetical protein KDJ35_01500 [Alphaproteobacteria bacterium]|nr:hypothetical protein [Alphaproteobacteria bacterium]
MPHTHARLFNGLLVLSGLALLSPLAISPAQAQDKRPALIITSDPLPTNLQGKLYAKPTVARDVQAYEISGQSYYQPTETVVTGKVAELRSDLSLIEGKVEGLADELASLQRANEGKAADYYASVATVNTQLQTGTTPGNPRLVQKLDKAEATLEDISNSVNGLNDVALNAAQVASEASFLLEETRAAYTLSGAVEEDHVALAQLEDTINNRLISIERILNNVNDDITRTATYLNSERNNLRTLSLAVANGDLYGKSLGNRPFSSAGSYQVASSNAVAGDASYNAAAAPLDSPRPLVKIRFNQPDVDYEQPVYTAVNEALERYPNAQFDLVAVSPTSGNAAEKAIESTRARRNAEKVLRTMTQLGLSLDRVALSQSESPDAQSSEVHIYIRP